MAKKSEEAIIQKGTNESKLQNKIEEDERKLQEMIAAEFPQKEEEEKPVEPAKKPEEKEELSENFMESPKEPENKSDSEDKEEQTWKKRYGDLRSHVNEMKAEFEEKIKALEEAKPEATPDTVTQADVEGWIEEYPRVGAIVQKIARDIANDLVSRSQKEVESVKETLKQTEKQKALAVIVEAHPEFTTYKSDPTFHDWVKEQPTWVSDALYRNSTDAKSVIRAIDLYKLDTGEVTRKQAEAKRKADLEAAREVEAKAKATVDPTGDTKKMRESDVAKMTSAEFEKNVDAIIEAQRTGNFIYDLSQKR